MPVTIKQILDANTEPGGDKLVTNNVNVEQVTLVVRIVEATFETTVISLMFDDCTGRISGSHILPVDDGSGSHELAVQKRQQVKQGVWTRVIGLVESTPTERRLSVYKLRAVEDFNEIIYHRLEVINVFLALTRPKAISTEASNQKPAPNVAGQPALQKRIFEYIKARHGAKPDDDQGVSITEVCRDVGGTPDSVREILEGFATDGHVYTTIDEFHFVYCAQ